MRQVGLEPTTHRLKVDCSTNWATVPAYQRPDLNWWHSDFQSNALTNWATLMLTFDLCYYVLNTSRSRGHFFGDLFIFEKCRHFYRRWRTRDLELTTTYVATASSSKKTHGVVYDDIFYQRKLVYLQLRLQIFWAKTLFDWIWTTKFWTCSIKCEMNKSGWNPAKFKKNCPLLNNSNPRVNCSFPATHSSFKWNLCFWMCWRNANRKSTRGFFNCPNDCTSCSFNLWEWKRTRFFCNQSEYHRSLCLYFLVREVLPKFWKMWL